MAININKWDYDPYSDQIRQSKERQYFEEKQRMMDEYARSAQYHQNGLMSGMQMQAPQQAKTNPNPEPNKVLLLLGDIT